MALEQYFLEEGKNVSDLATMALIYRLFSDYRLLNGSGSFKECPACKVFCLMKDYEQNREHFETEEHIRQGLPTMLIISVWV